MSSIPQQFNTFSVGQALYVLLFIPENGGPPIDANILGHLQSFDATRQMTEKEIPTILYGGKPINRNIYHGWHGEATFARFNSSMVSLLAAIQGEFQSGSGQETYYTISLEIQDAATLLPVTYLFQHCVIAGGNIGGIKATDEMIHTISFKGQTLLVNGVELQMPSLNLSL